LASCPKKIRISWSLLHGRVVLGVPKLNKHISFILKPQKGCLAEPMFENIKLFAACY
jgi:hypothetical protein